MAARVHPPGAPPRPSTFAQLEQDIRPLLRSHGERPLGAALSALEAHAPAESLSGNQMQAAKALFDDAQSIDRALGDPLPRHSRTRTR